MMAQPPILKAKISDHPALRDLANFVVPQASSRWYNLGLELFDTQDVATLNSMRTESNKTPTDHCTEVLNHWLVTKKNATWNKLIKSLKSRSVNLPILAGDVEKMLDTRSAFERGKHKFKKRFSRKSSQTLPTITDVSSSYDSSDVVENDESDEETLQASPSSSRYTFQRTDSVQSLYCKKTSIPMSMTNCQFRRQSRSQSMSTTSLPATLHPLGYDDDQTCEEKEHQHKYFSKDEQKGYTKAKNQESEQRCKQTLEKVANQLEELTQQLNMYEKEEKITEQYKQLLEKECSINKENLEQKHREIMQLKSELAYEKQANKEGLAALQSEQISQKLKDNEEANREELHNLQVKLKQLRREMNKKLESEEILRKEICTLQIEVEELKGENVRKLKSEEVLRKNLHNLQNKVEEFEREKAKILEREKAKILESEKAHREELRSLQIKVEELKRENDKKIESKEIFRKELHNLQVKVEETEREKAKNLEIKETNRKEFRSLQIKVEELTREKEKKLESEETVRKELHNIQAKVEESERKKAKILVSEETHREELRSLQIKVEELKRENDKKLESEETLRKELHNLQIIVEESKWEKARKLESEETHREELHSLQIQVEKLKRDVETEEFKKEKLKDKKGVHRKILNNPQLNTANHKKVDQLKVNCSSTPPPDSGLRFLGKTQPSHLQPPHLKPHVANRVSHSQINTQSSNHAKEQQSRIVRCGRFFLELLYCFIFLLFLLFFLGVASKFK